MGLYDVSTNEKKTNPELVAGGTLYADSPIGTILPYGGASAPSGWFLCDGSAVSRTTYSELFAIIGTSFGSGNGSTTFNLPDMRESVPKGAGLTGKTVGAHLDADGLAVGEFLDDRVQNFSIIGNMTYPGDNGGRFVFGRADIGTTAVKISQLSPDDRTGATTEVKSVGVNYIIKAKMVGVPSDFLAKVEEIVEFDEFEEISISSSSTTPTTITKSGMLTIPLQTAVGTDAKVYVNGVVVARSLQNGASEQITTVTLPVVKGDSIYVTGRQVTSGCYLRPYNFN